jgi:hypothetical protein
MVQQPSGPPSAIAAGRIPLTDVAFFFGRPFLQFFVWRPSLVEPL